MLGFFAKFRGIFANRAGGNAEFGEIFKQAAVNYRARYFRVFFYFRNGIFAVTAENSEACFALNPVTRVFLPAHIPVFANRAPAYALLPLHLVPAIALCFSAFVFLRTLRTFSPFRTPFGIFRKV
jgi:hypothetical protein